MSELVARAPRPAPRARPRRRPAAAEQRPAEGHVTVTIPYYECREHVRECVESVLAQTHAELTVVVVNDADPRPPWDLLADLGDPRLVCFDLPQNRGRYFADQVVLAATRSPYLLVHDADDWSEPGRVATLLRRLREEHASGAVSPAFRHAGAHERARVSACSVDGPPGARLQHRANHHGLFRTDALRAIGGLYAGLRIGYDTFLVNALLMTGRLASVDEPLYHWRVRPGSLTHARDTGIRSPARREVAALLETMYEEAYGAYREYVGGEIGGEELAARIRALGPGRVPAETGRELGRQARLLTARLSQRPARRRPVAVPARAAQARGPDVYALLADAEVAWSAWTISRALAVELAEWLERRRPRRVLELGSGISTAVLAQYAARTGAHVETREHSPVHAERTRRLLRRLGLGDAVDLRLAPLLPLLCSDGRTRQWYGEPPTGSFDFVLVDGPPLSAGRDAALFALDGHLARGWELWLDDAYRDHERDCIRLWERHTALSVSVRDVDGKGLAVLREPGSRRPRADQCPPGLGVGILTGGRPDLLRSTIETLAAGVPQLLERSVVLVLVNGQDEATEAYVHALPFVDGCIVVPRPLPVGPATSRLVGELAATPSVDAILHLEDDWAACTLEDGWLATAVTLLDSEPGIGQVRLRHRSDRVLAHHMVTRRSIAWQGEPGGTLRAAAAHFTFNPSLFRARDAGRVFPCRTEVEAQRSYLRTGLGSAQLTPGVFRHIGEGRSRRRR